jgi:hypothetical protein
MVAISDRQNRHFRVGIGKFFDWPEFGQILSEKWGNRKIGESAKSGNRQNRGIEKSGPPTKSAVWEKRRRIGDWSG